MNEDVRSVQAIGYTFIISAAVLGLFYGSAFLIPGSGFYLLGDAPPRPLLVAVAALNVALFLATGLGVITRRKWGYRLFRFTLLLMAPAFPVGTFIAYRGFAFARRDGVRRLFRLEP